MRTAEQTVAMLGQSSDEEPGLENSLNATGMGDQPASAPAPVPVPVLGSRASHNPPRANEL